MKKFIKDLKVGENLESVYLLKRKQMQKTKENKPYIRLTLSDNSGDIEAMVWDFAEEIDKRIDSGRAVFVKAFVDQWRDNIQLKIDDIRSASFEEYKIEDLLRRIDNTEELFEKVKGYLETISDKWLRILANRFLEDTAFISKFKQSPGAQSWHNAYIGGLLEHTYEVMLIVDKVCDLCQEANRDMCLIGAFLHDSGKILEIDPTTFEHTLQGGLIGHLSLGFELLSNKISQIEGFPLDSALYLKHIILSHHGEYQQQSPVLPKTLEATIVYHADELVSQTNAVKELINAQSSIQKVWSNYVTIKNRKYLLTRPKENSKIIDS